MAVQNVFGFVRKKKLFMKRRGMSHLMKIDSNNIFLPVTNFRCAMITKKHINFSH